jgi:uncharacterized membrane protein
MCAGAGHRTADCTRVRATNRGVNWSGPYWTIATTAWLVASLGGVAWTLATYSPWRYPEAWSGGWLLFIIALWWAIATLRSDSHGSDTPEEILKRRFAQGEIDEAEYRRARAALRD